MPKIRKGVLVQKSTGRQLKLGGYRPSAAGADANKYGADRYQEADLPAKVDLRPFMTPVEQQGELNSCVGNAAAGAYEYLANRSFGTSQDISRLFIYYNARAEDGDTEQDRGCVITNAIKTLKEKGACYESTWPYNPRAVFDKPHAQAYQEANQFTLRDAQSIEVDSFALRHCLAEGYPVCFGLQIFSSFQKVGSHGRVPIPDPSSEELLGGHAMLIAGYSDPDRIFIVRNSWGPDWGDRGYCYIPYDYILNSNATHDCWTIRGINLSDPNAEKTLDVNNVDFSQDVWIQDISSFFDYEEYDENEGLEDYELDYQYLEEFEEAFSSLTEDTETNYEDADEESEEIEEGHAEEDSEDTEDSYDEETDGSDEEEDDDSEDETDGSDEEEDDDFEDETDGSDEEEDDDFEDETDGSDEEEDDDSEDETDESDEEEEEYDDEDDEGEEECDESDESDDGSEDEYDDEGEGDRAE